MGPKVQKSQNRQREKEEERLRKRSKEALKIASATNYKFQFYVVLISLLKVMHSLSLGENNQIENFSTNKVRRLMKILLAHANEQTNKG